MSKGEKAIRRFCRSCQGDSSAAVQSCPDTHCALHPVRLCTLTPLPPESRPLRAIRCYCMVCAGGKEAVRQCTAKESCVLWSFRFGVLPATFKKVVARLRKKRETILLPGMLK